MREGMTGKNNSEAIFTLFIIRVVSENARLVHTGLNKYFPFILF